MTELAFIMFTFLQKNKNKKWLKHKVMIYGLNKGRTPIYLLAKSLSKHSAKGSVKIGSLTGSLQALQSYLLHDE